MKTTYVPVIQPAPRAENNDPIVSLVSPTLSAKRSKLGPRLPTINPSAAMKFN